LGDINIEAKRRSLVLMAFYVTQWIHRTVWPNGKRAYCTNKMRAVISHQTYLLRALVSYSKLLTEVVPSLRCRN